MPFMDDEHIAAALSQPCPVCGTPAGLECVQPDSTGLPLLETTGRPVHVRRLDL